MNFSVTSNSVLRMFCLQEQIIYSLFSLSTFFKSDLKAVVVQCTLFTIAHTLTLALSVAGVLIPNPSIVEPLIALSIFVAAVENIVSENVNRIRMAVVFFFGLVHGMGFAAGLQAIEPGRTVLVSSLLGFNLGVELAQLSVLFGAWLAVGAWFSRKSWYQAAVAYPFSVIIACVALYWTITRIINPVS